MSPYKNNLHTQIQILRDTHTYVMNVRDIYILLTYHNNCGIHQCM